jgi:hypothetical protein
MLPQWITKSGNLGTIEERQFYKFELEADNTNSFRLISGRLPDGMSLRENGVIDGVPNVTNLLKGVPFDVSESVTSTFVVRATSSAGVNDRTFSLTVSGQDKPSILTPGPNLGEFIEGTTVSIDIVAEDLDNDPLNWRVAAGSLPRGLSLDQSTGVISGLLEPLPGEDSRTAGYDATKFSEFEFDFGSQSVSKRYFFAISVSDGKDTVQRNFSIFVHSRNTFIADSTAITADTSFITADQTVYRSPVLLNTNRDLGQVFHDNYFSYKFSGLDFDSSQLNYEIQANSSEYSLPPGLSLDPKTGWLYGYISYQFRTEKVYRFRVRVVKVDSPDYASNWVEFKLVVLGESSRDITWETPEDLGTIYTGDVSTLQVVAKDASNRNLQYYLGVPQALSELGFADVSPVYDASAVGFDNSFYDQYGFDFSSNVDTSVPHYSLPQGLKFTADGMLVGRVNFAAFSLDGGKTTIDKTTANYSNTEFDAVYKFQVTAANPSKTVISRREFTVRVAKRSNEPYENLFVRAFPTLQSRKYFETLVNNADIIKPSYVYRNNDYYFGRQSDIRMLVLPGVTAETAATFVEAMETHHYNKTLKFGGVKVAKAKDTNGNVLYEVVYFDVIDDIKNIEYTHQLPINSRLQAGQSVVYPNSLSNMIRVIKDQVGINTTSAFPLWMTTKQDSGSVLGWIPAVVVAYTKPGCGELVAYNISNSDFDIKQISFEIDRYIWDNDMTQNFDKTLREYYESAETKFDVKNTATFTVSESDFVSFGWEPAEVLDSSYDGDFEDSEVIFEPLDVINGWEIGEVREGASITSRFTMPKPVANPAGVIVHVDGVALASSAYTVSGNSITIVESVIEIGSIVHIEATEFAPSTSQTTFDNNTTRFISGSYSYRDKDYGDKYLKFPNTGVLN